MVWPLIASLIIPLIAGVCLCGVLWDKNLCLIRDAPSTAGHDHRVCVGVYTEFQVLSTCTVLQMWPFFFCIVGHLHTWSLSSTPLSMVAVCCICCVRFCSEFYSQHPCHIPPLWLLWLLCIWIHRIVYCWGVPTHCLCTCVKQEFSLLSTIGFRAGTTSFFLNSLPVGIVVSYPARFCMCSTWWSCSSKMKMMFNDGRVFL